jgi:hypothetical protein
MENILKKLGDVNYVDRFAARVSPRAASVTASPNSWPPTIGRCADWRRP